MKGYSSPQITRILSNLKRKGKREKVRSTKFEIRNTKQIQKHKIKKARMGIIMLKKHFFIYLIICMSLPGCKRFWSSDFTIKNDSGVLIKKAEVAVSGRNFAAENIKPGEYRKFKYSVNQESNYEIVIEFYDGRLLTKSGGGYMTSRESYHHAIIVSADDIRITREQK